MLVDTSDLVSVTELGRGLSRYVNVTAETGRRLVILNSNTPTAALVSIADLEKLQAVDVQAMATAPPPDPPSDESLAPPRQGDLEQRPGMSAVGRDDRAQVVYWPLTEHHFVAGRTGQGAGLLFSAAIAGAVPDPHVRTEFVVATSRSHVALRHERLHPDIAVVVEVDLDVPGRRERFIEKLDGEINRRRDLLREHHVDTLAEYRQLGSKAHDAGVANLVVVVTDPSALIGEGATIGSLTTDPFLTLIAKNGQDLGIYLWIGLPESDRAGQGNLRSELAQYIPRRYAMGSLDTVAESRLLLGTDAAALGPVPPGTGWARTTTHGWGTRFAVAEPTGGPGVVVTASGQCHSWATGLTEPLTLADIPEVSTDDDCGLTIPIGITGSRRAAPLTVTVNGSSPHLCLMGGDGSGCTTALHTIIVSAGMRYRPRQCTFLVIAATEDHMSQMAAMPNVAGAATALDPDRVDRILGEALRIIAIRQAAFTERNVNTLEEYLGADGPGPAAGDPYGRLIVAIDELERLTDDYKDQLTQLAQTGGQHGVHLVVTTHNVRIPMAIVDRLRCLIRLGGSDIQHEALLVHPKRHRDLARGIPSGQPGRCIDTQSERHGRIALPYPGHYDPQPTSDPAARFPELVADAGLSIETAGKLRFVPTSIAPDDFWDQADVDYVPPLVTASVERRAAMDVRIPLGVSIATAAVVDVPDAQSPHLLAVGSTGSGRTSLIRALLAAIRHRFSPNGAEGRPEAKIVLIDGLDGCGEMADERAILKRDGYLLGDGMDTEQAVQAVEKMITSRVPAMDHPPLSAQQWRDRTWYQGPEVFVLIDAQAMGPNGAKGILNAPVWPTVLARLIEERDDLGLHVYVAGSAPGFPAARLTDPLYRSLANVPTLMLSGPAGEGVVWPGSGLRFQNRPAGRGQLVDPFTLNTQVIQIPWYEAE